MKIMTKVELDEMFESRSDDTVRIENCTIMNMDLGDYDLRDLVLRNVVFRNVEFSCAIISNWNADNVAFRACTANMTRIENSSFAYCVFDNSTFPDCLIRNSDFCHCDIIDLNIPRTMINRVTIINSSVLGTNFTMSDFYRCSIKKTEFHNCCFFKVGFSNTNVKEISALLNVGLSFACPEAGSFIGYKKILVGETCPSEENEFGFEGNEYEYAIAKLLIPEDAKRLSATSKVCRCDKANVLEILDLDGNKLSVDKGRSSHDHHFEYEVGKMVSVDDFNENRWAFCTTGIHFFTSFQDAVEYGI